MFNSIQAPSISSFSWTNGSDEYFSDSDQEISGSTDLGDGNDKITINENHIGIWIEESGQLYAGAGDDHIQVNSLSGTTGIGISGLLSMGAGNDTVQSNGTWNKGIIVYGALDLGPGSNSIVATATYTPLKVWGGAIQGGDNDDSIMAIPLIPSETTINPSIDVLGGKIELGLGDDTIDAFKGSLDLSGSSILMGGGDDTLKTNSSLILRRADLIDTGSGNDFIMASGYIDSSSYVLLGDGDDVYMGYLGGPRFSNARGYVDGGAGEDTLELTAAAIYDVFEEDEYLVVQRRPKENGTVFSAMSTIGFEWIQGKAGPNYSLREGTYILSPSGEISSNTSDLMTYSIEPSINTITEGQELTTKVVTTGLANGSTLYWALSGISITASDFAAGAMSGLGSISNGAFAFSHTLKSDQLTEGNESLHIKLYSDPARTQQVGSTSTVTIIDTSKSGVNDGQAAFSITGDPNVGQRLTASITINDPDGNGTFSHTWEASANGSVWASIITSPSLTITSDLEGKKIRLQTSYRDGDGFDEVITSQETLAIANVNSTEKQQITAEKAPITYRPGTSVSIPLLYSTSNNDSGLSGLTLNIHHDSNRLTPAATNNGITNQLQADSVTATTIQPDTSDLDGSADTDQMIQLSWGSVDNSFPGTSLPAQVAVANFETSSDAYDPVTGEPVNTEVNFTASETSSNYGFEGTPVTLVPESFHLDIDGDGRTTALGDGLMVIRKLFGSAFAGDALTNKAGSANAAVDTEAMHHWLEAGIASGDLDVDKDGKTTALGDGLMVIRHMFGSAFAGDALIEKAISNSSPYAGQSNAAEMVSANIDSLMNLA